MIEEGEQQCEEMKLDEHERGEIKGRGVMSDDTRTLRGCVFNIESIRFFCILKVHRYSITNL
jgi:hypothetical protein